ncbi:hypothetical protein FN846DRAFT_315661 [Sphaerosporella brunnea]|uniref:Uncharacterized protein n=1 Tax=Sphaerosporella brunnea TaxID=1250544 RepID=A0A5J5EJA2_9PEZI|nr:hypothetical protein FN846DRAFT_315661 [Sphaerosporella brunnea]
MVPFQEHCRIVANLISKCATAATPSDSSPSPTSRDRAYVDLVHYTLFHGARKLERRLLSKKMPHDHWTVLKDLDVAAVKPRPIKEFLHLFDQAERESLLQAFEVLGMDEQHYETLFTVVKNGTEAITTPHDGQTLFMQYHRFVLEVLEKAEKPVRNLRNNYNKFCKPKTGTPPKAEAPANTESSSKTTSSPKWNIPSEEQLRHALNDVYVVLRPLAHMAWESPLFDWTTTMAVVMG